MHPKIKALIARLIEMAKNNKKQIYSSVLVFAIITILRKKGSYFIKLLPFNFFIQKFTQRYLKLLEKTIEEESRLKSKLQILEMAPFSYYEDWSKLEIRGNLDQLFNISEIKENLKRKDINQEEKALLWDSFKKENFLRTVFTLISSGIEGASKELARVLSEKWKEGGGGRREGGERKEEERRRREEELRRREEEGSRREEEEKGRSEEGKRRGMEEEGRRREEEGRRRGGRMKEEESGWSIEERRRVEEGFVFFMKFVLDEGMQGLFYFLRSEVQDEVKNIRITQKIKFEDFLQILGSIEKRVLRFIEKGIKSGEREKEEGEGEGEKKKEGGKERREGIERRMGGSRWEEGGRRREGGGRRRVEWRFWKEGDLELPNLSLAMMDSFIRNVEGHPILYDEEYLDGFVNQLAEKQNVLSSREEEEEGGRREEEEQKQKEVGTRSEEERRTEGGRGRKDENGGRKEEKRRKDEEERRRDEEGRRKVGRRVHEICNEYLDWLESRNFHILLYHMVKFEFLKLKNRLLLHDLKNMNKDNRVILNYITAMFRITNEEFLCKEAVKTNENFYNNKIKLAIHSLSLSSPDQSENFLTFLILEEFQTKRRLEQGWSELMKRVLLEEERYFIRKEGGTKEEAGGDIEELLRKLG